MRLRDPHTEIDLQVILGIPSLATNIRIRIYEGGQQDGTNGLKLQLAMQTRQVPKTLNSITPDGRRCMTCKRDQEGLGPVRIRLMQCNR